MHRVSVLAVFPIFFKSGSKFSEIIYTMLKLHSILLVKVKALTFEQCYVAETFHCDISEMFTAMSLRCYNAMSLSVDIWTYSEHSCDVSRMLQCYVAETFHCDVSEMFTAMSRRRYNAMSLSVDIWTYSEHPCDVLAMKRNIYETSQHRSATYWRCCRDWFVLCGFMILQLLMGFSRRYSIFIGT